LLGSFDWLHPRPKILEARQHPLSVADQLHQQMRQHFQERWQQMQGSNS
jgi:hypothetical protein